MLLKLIKPTMNKEFSNKRLVAHDLNPSIKRLLLQREFIKRKVISLCLSYQAINKYALYVPERLKDVEEHF